jgi:ATP-dependent Lon protease
VLPVGGIREKALAARRYGIKTMVLPALNEPDLSELPEDVRRDMKFVPVRTLEEALAVAMPGTITAGLATADKGMGGAAASAARPAHD